MTVGDAPRHFGEAEGRPGTMAAAASLADALRRVHGLLVGRPIGEEALAEATRSVAEVADRLDREADPGRLPRDQPVPGVDARELFPMSPVVGRANPVAPPVEIWTVEGERGVPEVRGRAWFDYPYEGPPTCVHGGVIAAVFDELLGAVNIVVGQPGLTGTLTVTYRRPTPLRAPLDLAARQTAVEGRKVRSWGAIYHDGELTAEAEGVFVAIDPQRIARIATENARRSGGEVPDGLFATGPEPGPSPGGPAVPDPGRAPA